MTTTGADGTRRRTRILDPRIAALLAGLRPGEVVAVSDAGLGTHPKTVIPMDPSVEIIDIGIATNVPRVPDVVDALLSAGDFGAAIVGDLTVTYNEPFHRFLVDRLGAYHVHEVPHFPKYYVLRDRARANIQAGDFGAAFNVLLVAGRSGEEADDAGPLGPHRDPQED